MNRFIKNTTS